MKTAPDTKTPKRRYEMKARAVATAATRARIRQQRMARILTYTSPARGHLFPLTPILGQLRQRGHQVALRTLASGVLLMHSRGFDAAPISERAEPGARTK